MESSTSVGRTDDWDVVIRADNKRSSLNLKELWGYRDLLRMFVKKDIITVYKQTVLGPIWFVLQPILTTIIFTFVFGSIAKIGTDGPGPLFYLIGNTLWGYFAETLNVTSRTFIDNASVFGKVYFPRLILPLSKVASGMVKLGIQFVLVIATWAYYLHAGAVQPTIHLLLLPVLIAMLSAIGFGFGILITSMTTKYRDLIMLLTFGVQLWMFATPVIYPLSKYANARVRTYLLLNPLTSIFEAIKFGFIGKGYFSWPWLGYSLLFALVLLTAGITTFNKVERRFIDTV